MSRVRIAQQTTTARSAGERSGAARASLPRWGSYSAGQGLLQWLLEDGGWTIVRPTVDFLLVCAATVVALGGVDAAAHVSARRAPLLAIPFLVMLYLHLCDVYRTRLRALVLDGLVPIAGAVSLAAMTVALIGLALNGRVPDQATWVRAWLFALLALGVGRLVLGTAQRWARSTLRVGKPVLIMGAGVVGAQLARRLESHREYGLRPVGFLDDDPRSIAEVGGREVPVLGTVEDLDRVVARTGVRSLIVAFSSVADERVSRLIQHCQQLGIEVSVVPRMFDTINHRVGYDSVGGLPLMSFSAVDPRGVQFTVKHAFDRVMAAILLMVLSPVAIAATVAVRLSSPGPVLFRQRRVGRDGKVFDLYKFRSMRWDPAVDDGADPEELGAAISARDDETALDFMLGGDTAPGGVEGEDRRTMVGRILRRTSLDELPQLLNVLAGEMSIVGPRPERPEFVELFRQDIARYGDRHRVRSGITGWAQVHGLRGQTSLAERVEWDNYYIAHWSLGLDCKILLLTLTSVFRNAE